MSDMVYVSRSVHPRVRGEQSPPSRKDGHCYGSSPRARGADPCAAPYLRQPRFIPACAGSRVLSPIFTVSETVHPRVRGEQSSGSANAAGLDGSSPRARGAGPVKTTRLLAWTVHPRVRGEQHAALKSEGKTTGSSPRARGAGAISAMNGIEPSVHPRVRGEQGLRLCSTVRSRGSSPRARGADLLLPSLSMPTRFIPACAGSSPATGTAVRCPPVHPRVRGEQILTNSILRGVFGSSPRARGADLLTEFFSFSYRFIPACAGSRIEVDG